MSHDVKTGEHNGSKAEQRIFHYTVAENYNKIRRAGAMFASAADSSGEPNARSRSRVDRGHRDPVARRRRGW